jgi:P4 family phage/plasmid primase-like protien
MGSTERNGTLYTDARPKVKHNCFDFYVANNFRLLALDSRPEINGEPNPAYRKRPVIADWTKRKGISPATAKQRMKNGHNIGAAIPDDIVVIDVDTRHGGLDSLCGLLDSLSGPATGHRLPRPLSGSWTPDEAIAHVTAQTFSVRTSDKGHHFYFRRDPSIPLVAKAGEGIDVLSVGRQVVTPGSVHPRTGEIYTSVGVETIAELPEYLKSVLVAGSSTFSVSDLEDMKHRVNASKANSLWGTVTDEGAIERLLCALPPEEYRDYNEAWFPLLCSCHHASAGSEQAKAVFVNWSSWDGKYPDDVAPVVDEKWRGLGERRRGGEGPLSTVLTLLSCAEKECKKLTLAGHEPTTVLRRKQSSAGSRCLYGSGNTLFVDAVTLAEVKKGCADIRNAILATDLDDIPSEKDASTLLSWIDSLQPGWEKAQPELKQELIEAASALGNALWPEIASALAKASSYSLSAVKVEKQIKEAHNASRKGDDGLTYAEIVEATAALAIKKIVAHDGASDDYIKNLTCPPNSVLYKYVNGKWSEEPRGVVAGVCYSKVFEVADLSKKSSKPATDYADKAVSTIIKKVSSASTELYARQKHPNCINLTNGTLWFHGDQPPELRPHNRDDLLTSQIAYAFDPSATCPGFDLMLEQAFEHAGPDRGELIRHFYELTGYMIQANKDIPLILFWTGAGRNGKSTISRVISRLVGDAWFGTKIKSFFSDSQPHNMHAAQGRLVLCDDDLTRGVTLNDGDLKKISESKSILVNPKNRDHYSIYLQLTPLILSNSVPHIVDISAGMRERLDVIFFGTDFSKRPVSKLPKIVEAEQMPGVLNRAVEGLARLRARGKFDPPACSAAYRKSLLIKANTVYGFLDYAGAGKGGALGRVDDLYDEYKSYVWRDSEHDRHAVPKMAFKSDLLHCGAIFEGDRVVGFGPGDFEDEIDLR